ncbi:heterokaryon incompatibility protein-domain-containing protein [Thermothelomyces heterothallicus CBS 202.75]|uniref:heterokaryon incompatibility protein-domain-containing protein n=1 Tax=Thermothelomyces heterothallicus CBS 202.75 TaxID=1149848 RepID=UPI0037448116
MAGTSLYTYNPIQPNQIRLLKFVQDGDHICAVLETFSLEEPLPVYRSISYTWASDGGRPQKNFKIEIDKRKLPVLSTLQPFFQALRSRNMLLDGKWWWIDSICIDQANLEERAHQVGHMDVIYRQAESVIAWLGEASSDSELAIDFIKLLDKTSRRKLSVAELRATLQQDHYRTHWKALTNFLSRRWWSRIWSVQEFVLAPSVTFWCGMRNVSRVAVCRSIGIADKCTSTGIKETLAFTHGNNRRRAWGLYKASKKPGASLSFSLLALAAYFCCMDASDDRDRLYGVMALATDRSMLEIDYTLRTDEVYTRFAQSFITHYKSLDIICFASTYTPPSGSIRPSWVPDWQKRNPVVIPSMTSQSSKTHVGNLRSPRHLDIDPSVYYSACKNKEAVYAFEGSALQVRGVVVDTIDGLAGSRQFEMVQSSEWNSTQSSCCSGFPCSTTAILESIHGRSFEDILHDSFQADDDSSVPAPNIDESQHKTFFGRFFDTVVRLSFRLMVSRSGRIGMVVEKAMKGDLLCVLYGCSIPVVLRKSSDGGSYTLIGECYLDGCMDGSLLDQSQLWYHRPFPVVRAQRQASAPANSPCDTAVLHNFYAMKLSIALQHVYAALAIAESRDALMAMLLAQGANINLEAQPNGTALIAACDRGYLPTVQLLLDRQAHVDPTTAPQTYHHGTVTALVVASTRGHLPVVQLLLKRGADPNFMP